MRRTRHILKAITTTLFLVSGGLLEAQPPPFERVCRDQMADLAVGALTSPAQDFVPGGAAGTCDRDREALRRYWHYRRRLVSDFLVVGNCCGCSLPAFTRSNEKIDWADSGIVFSWYISVLATEYKLLSDFGQDTSKTGLELCYAIKAFNRLDSTAEPYWRAWKQNGSVPECITTSDPPNGFFIRDDVPSNFLQGGGLSLLPGRYSHYSPTEIDSGFITGVHKEGVGPREQSLDQTYPLILAFGLVSKFVPPGVNFFGCYPSDEARHIVTRMVDHMRSGYPGRPWVIRNPATGECPKGVNWTKSCGVFDQEKCICGGANNLALSYGITMAHCEVDTDFSSTKLQCESGYVDPVAALTKPAWLAFEPLNTIGKEEIKILELAATGESWRTTGSDVGRQALYNDIEDKALVHQAFFGGPAFIERSHFQCLIDTAPCEGPSGQGPFEWSSSHRFRNAEERGSGSPVDYNGLDYMLLYNLYRIAYGNTVSVPYEVTPDDCDAGCDRDVICEAKGRECTACSADKQCLSSECRNKPVGLCITPASVNLGASCCKDGQCKSGSCNSDGRCQCKRSSDCPAGNYCDLGTLGIGQNECKVMKGECAECSADKQCLSGECRNKPVGRCITPASVNLGASCCKDGQCESGSCNSDGRCQCKQSSDCPSGHYCALGFLGIGENECRAYIGECQACSANRQCGPGRDCKLFECITPHSLGSGASCCRDQQCVSDRCKNATHKCS